MCSPFLFSYDDSDLFRKYLIGATASKRCDAGPKNYAKSSSQNSGRPRFSVPNYPVTASLPPEAGCTLHVHTQSYRVSLTLDEADESTVVASPTLDVAGVSIISAGEGN